MPAPALRQIVKACLKKCFQWYKTSAIILVNTLVLIVAVNVVLYYVFKIKDSSDEPAAPLPPVENPVFQKYGEAVVLQAYPDLRREEVEQLLYETWSTSLIYDPFTLFKEQPKTGKWVNVDRAGFRSIKGQGPWPPDPKNQNVFVFGGSTTFGYGIPDGDTIPSHLQEFLQDHWGPQVRVYNFGRGFYYSTQERILFEKLLGAGHVPDVAVFIDGINDSYWEDIQQDDRPTVFQDVLGQAFQGPPPVTTREVYRSLLTELPMARAANSVKRRLGLKENPQPKEPVSDEADPGEFGKVVREHYDQAWPLIVKRYYRNKQMVEGICRSFRVTPLFVWQPAPAYKYDLSHHVFAQQLWSFEHDPRTYVYPWVAKKVAERPEELTENFLWLADMQEQAKENLYVDQWHYKGKFCRQIAASIGSHLIEQQLLGATR